MRILISGATGFIGNNLIEYLQEHSTGIEIVRLIRTKETASDITWDEINLSSLKGFDAIIHLAGKAHDTKNTSDDAEYFKVNFELTKKLYDLFLQSDLKKFIFMSSVKAVADKVDGTLVESALANPATAYGKSKLKAEEYIVEQSVHSNKQYYILRPCMIHGPGNKGNLNLLYQFARLGIPYPLASFENKRSFLSIDNLCFVIQKLLEQEIESGIYQVADDETLSTSELVINMALANNKQPKLWKVAKELVINTAKVGDKFNLPLNSERLQKLTESYVVSNEKIKKAIGVSNLPQPAREGLMRTIKSFIKND